MRNSLYKGRFILILLGIAAFLTVTSFVVMNLWNYLLPGILHVGVITFWQAMGIFVLCKILFGFGKGGRGWGGGGGNWMRHGMAEKLKNMPPEQREDFKTKWQERCGHDRWRGRHNWDNFAEETTKTAE